MGDDWVLVFLFEDYRKTNCRSSLSTLFKRRTTELTSKSLSLAISESSSRILMETRWPSFRHCLDFRYRLLLLFFSPASQVHLGRGVDNVPGVKMAPFDNLLAGVASEWLGNAASRLRARNVLAGQNDPAAKEAPHCHRGRKDGRRELRVMVIPAVKGDFIAIRIWISLYVHEWPGSFARPRMGSNSRGRPNPERDVPGIKLDRSPFRLMRAWRPTKPLPALSLTPPKPGTRLQSLTNEPVGALSDPSHLELSKSVSCTPSHAVRQPRPDATKESGSRAASKRNPRLNHRFPSIERAEFFKQKSRPLCFRIIKH